MSVLLERQEICAMENLNMILRDRLSPVFIFKVIIGMLQRTVVIISRAGLLP